MSNSGSASFRACIDALLHHTDGAWVLSNPRTRCHIELDRAAIAAFTEHAAGASEELWQSALASAQGRDRTAPTGENGLWGDPTGLAARDGAMLGGAGFVLAEYRHPEISGGDCGDPALSAHASEYPLWDFLTFRQWPKEGGSHAHA